MSVFWWILIIIGIIIGIILLGIIITILSLFLSSSSENPDDAINHEIKLLKNFMGYDFSDKYTIPENYLHYTHPDRVKKIKLEFSEEDFQGILSYIKGLEMKETRYYNRKNDVLYIDKWEYTLDIPSWEPDLTFNILKKSHQAYHHSKDGDFIFFSASLYINTDKHYIRYSESMI